MSKKLNRQEVAVLIKETIENKLFESKLNEDIKNIFETRQDLESKMLISMMEELSGRKIPDPTVLDEGVWEKAKGLLAKIRLSKSTGASQQRDALEAAADNAANAQFSKLFSELKQMPGFDKYPNNTEEDQFVGITTAIGLMFEAVSKAHKDGMIETDTANDLVGKLKSYAEGLNSDLSYSFRYLNEDDDEDPDPPAAGLEEEQLNERAFTDYNRALRLLKKAKAGKIKPWQMRKLNRIRNGLEKEFQKRGGTKGMTNKEQDLLGKFSKDADVFNQYDAKGNWTPEVEKNWTPEPDTGPTPEPPGGGGGGGGGGGKGTQPNLGASEIGDPSFGVGDISGITSLPKLYMKAGSLATLNTWMGGPFLGQLAAFALPAAAIAGIAGLVGKRLMGKSREGSLKKLAGMMTPLDPQDHGSESPDPQTGAADDQAPLGGGEDEQAPLGGGAEAGGTPGGTPAPGGGDSCGETSHCGKWVAAGKPSIEDWLKQSNGKIISVTGDADSYISNSDPDGPPPDGGPIGPLLTPDALELGKLQLAYKEKNPETPMRGPLPALQKAIKDTEGAPYDEEEEETISDDEITTGLATGGGPGHGNQNLAETVNRWQKIAGIIKG